MERFDDAIRVDYPEHDTPNDIETALEAFHRLKLPACDGIALSPVSKLPAQLTTLTQVSVRRMIELTEAAIREINRRNLVTTALLSRAALETSCLLWDVTRQGEDVARGNDLDRLEEFKTLIEKSLAGGKAPHFRLSEEIEARSVITIVQRLTKSLDVPLWGYFERLSEFAHPNYHGMMGSYSEAAEESGAIQTFWDRRESMVRPLILTALGTLATSGRIVIWSFEIFARNLKPLALLSERSIHERGTWPADEPYPVSR